MDVKTYTVMELAARINVPRTTINEWLSRYASYVDFQVCGKRRLYTEKTLDILKEISVLRNEGKTLNEISETLRLKHPLQIRPEEQVEEPEYVAEKTPEETPSPKDEEFAVIARQQNEELGRMIGESFRDMAERLEELEKSEKHSRKVTLLWALFAILILLGGVGTAFAAARLLSAVNHEKDLLLQRNEHQEKQLELLQNQTVKLDSESREFQKNVRKLETELSAQKTLFDKTIRETRESAERAGKAALEAEKRLAAEKIQSMEQRRKLEQEKQSALLKQKETELALEKEKFAAERLKLLKELEVLKSQKKPAAKKTEKKVITPKPEPVKKPAAEK